MLIKIKHKLKLSSFHNTALKDESALASIADTNTYVSYETEKFSADVSISH